VTLVVQLKLVLMTGHLEVQGAGSKVVRGVLIGANHEHHLQDADLVDTRRDLYDGDVLPLHDQPLTQSLVSQFSDVVDVAVDVVDVVVDGEVAVQGRGAVVWAVQGALVSTDVTSCLKHLYSAVVDAPAFSGDVVTLCGVKVSLLGTAWHVGVTHEMLEVETTWAGHTISLHVWWCHPVLVSALGSSGPLICSHHLLTSVSSLTKKTTLLGHTLLLRAQRLQDTMCFVASAAEGHVIPAFLGLYSAYLA